MQKVYKKQVIEENVLDQARLRVSELFDRFDKVAVSFSGGKDSTVCLNLCLEEARRRGRTPLDVYFWDEEAIAPDTIEYCERVRSLPDVRFKWLCIPIKHRNACSRHEPSWYPWDPEKKHLWVRPMPKDVITHIDRFKKGMTVPKITHRVYSKSDGLVADVRGIRADESLTRFMSVAKRKHDNWVGRAKNGYNSPASPIYDWTSFDVWLAPKLFGWDYNRAYDLMQMVGVPFQAQRVCPPFGEEPLQNLWIYSQCWPDLWHRMIHRVDGAATACRYSRTELYGFGKLEKPRGLTWREWTFRLLELYPEEVKPLIAKSLFSMIKRHKGKTKRPISEDVPDILTGICWRSLAMIANRGDLKGRRASSMTSKVENRIKRENLNREELFDAEGSVRY